MSKRSEKARRQREIAIRLWGGVCVECGKDNANILDFHHKDPSTKSQGLSYMWAHASLDRIYEELDKCELLCMTCHGKESNTHRPSAQHGTRSKYNGGCRCDACKEANRDYEYKRRNG